MVFLIHKLNLKQVYWWTFCMTIFKKTAPCIPVLIVFLGMSLLLSSTGFSKQRYTKKQRWVDSVFHALTFEEKIGQLIMVAAYSNRDESHYKYIEQLITSYKIGGLIFFQGGPVRQAILTNRYQSKSKLPLFIAIDAEWGLGMRLDSTIHFPRQMTLGAIEDNDYIYHMGVEIAKQCKRLGIHINFAPVVDINTNPENPVIGYRSFGENKYNVAEKGIAFMQGMQDQGVMACAKHFPGHGDTNSDSHVTMPVITHSSSRLKQVELYPFNELIKDSIQSIMVAHIHVPAYDTTASLPSSLSKNVITNVLINGLHFKGLIFSDALNMKGVTGFFSPGDLEVKALLAGNDILLYPQDIPRVIEKIKEAVKNKKLSLDIIDYKVKKILHAKYDAGLHAYKPIDLTHLYEELNHPASYAIRQSIYQQTITVVKNKNNLIPFRVLDTLQFASVAIGIDDPTPFQQQLSCYAPFIHYAIKDKYASDSIYQDILKKVQNYKVVVVSLHGLSNASANGFNISYSSKQFIDQLRSKTNVVVVLFGNPYALRYFQDVDYLISAYEDQSIVHKIVPQILFGAISLKSKLPVSASSGIQQGAGNKISYLNRLQYAWPEHVGMDSHSLQAIDSIVKEGIQSKAFPGCQVLVARHGKVVFDKVYGYLTYDTVHHVAPSTLYDIASITKVAATLQAVMFLQEQGLLDLDQKASFYLSELKDSNKKDMTIRELLLHQAGLLSFIPFWSRTLDGDKKLDQNYYKRTSDENFSVEVAYGIYTIKSIEDSIWKWTVQSDLLPKNKEGKYDYKYSDAGFYILKRIVEQLVNQPMAIFLKQNFYDPLGLSTLTYQPLCKFPDQCMAPTENDTQFRNIILQGTVHDQGAALNGGIAGHAGLFSNAYDLATLFQMNLQNGNYGGELYFKKPSTLSIFTSKQTDTNRRGLGWDKPSLQSDGPTSTLASPSTYGHTGFTGTCVWVDPEKELVYVFLSNRVYPDATNYTITKSNIRTRIHDLIYQSILNYELMYKTTGLMLR